MKFNSFFRITWLVQILVGISLFSVSFLIESKSITGLYQHAVISPFSGWLPGGWKSWRYYLASLYVA